MSALQMGVPASLSPGDVMDPEHFAGPVRKIEAWSQGRVDSTNLAVGDPAVLHNYALKGRNFRTRAFSEVVRFREPGPQLLVAQDNGAFFSRGAGEDNSEIVGGCQRFHAREDIDSVFVTLNLRVFCGHAYGGFPLQAQALAWSGWWDDTRPYYVETISSKMNGFTPASEYRSTTHTWAVTWGAPTSGLYHKAGWHEVRHAITLVENADTPTQTLVDQAELTIVMVYR